MDISRNIMTDQEGKLETYLIKYIHHELTPEESVELEILLKTSPENRELLVKCLTLYKNYRKLEFLRSRKQEEAWRIICEKRSKLRVYKLRRWLSYAALIFLLVGTGLSGYLFFYSNLGQQWTDDRYEGERPQVILTLSDGRQVVLGKCREVIDEKGCMIIKDSLSPLSYQNSSDGQDKIEYNKLTIPKGTYYSLVLADGTKVWLNSDSYLRYPVCFPKEIREVELVGEAYFEVVKELNRPFAVKVGANRIEVLGTHFNISAYGEEHPVYTTLAEGSVRVKTAEGEKILIPGEQALMGWEGEKLQVRKVDPQMYISWRLGVYEFQNTPLSEIALCLARWYDAEISFISAGIKNKRFTGAIQRKDSLNFTLENLEKISGLRFVVDGRKVVVGTK